MIASIFLATSIAAAPLWLEQAFEGRSGSKWTAVVAMDHPGPGDQRDTGGACRDGTSERLVFRHGNLVMTGDSSIFLETATKTAWIGPRRRFPTPPDARIDIVRGEKILGRQVAVVEIRGPRGGGRRLWVDTTIPLVLRSEHLRSEAGPPDRQILSLQIGTPCPAGSFAIPAGWTSKPGHPPPPNGPDGRPDPRHRRHAVASAVALAEAVGFTPPPPPWLPAGFAARNWAWVDTREGKAAQIFYDDGAKSLSIFFRPGAEAPPLCPPEGCKDREGRAVYFGRVDKFGLAVTGDLAPELMEKVAGIRK